MSSDRGVVPAATTCPSRLLLIVEPVSHANCSSCYNVLRQHRCCSPDACHFLYTHIPHYRTKAVSETARRFMSWNILLSHSRSLKVIPN